MAISLYDLSVASFLQTLGGVAGFLQRGLDHCRDNNTDPSEIVETRLYGPRLKILHPWPSSLRDGGAPPQPSPSEDKE
jgi:hypothetical protein